MDDYPEIVKRIAGDYLERMDSKLAPLPAAEREEFLREIHSHIYEAYCRAPEGDEVTRILGVLRNLGEPADVISDRLPETMVRSGTRRRMPLFVLSGILIALFGIPLGFGGVAFLAGVLATLGAMVAAYYAAAGTIFLAAALFVSMGAARLLLPELWDRLVRLGFIQMNGPVADFLDQLPPSEQGLLILAIGALFAAGGLGMLRAGRYLRRGFHFLLSLMLDWFRRGAQHLGRTLRRYRRAGNPGWQAAGIAGRY